MTLNDCEVNKNCKIVKLNIIDTKIKLRLYEIGFFKNSQIILLNKSFLKNTFLVYLLDSCFTIKREMAECIEVEYE